jgi:hypothetical protein
LSQVYDGIERLLAYGSRQANKAQQNYCASKQELLAVTLAAKYFRCYLYGKLFILHTDQVALVYLRSLADNNCRRMRWSLRLAERDFEVQNRAGEKLRQSGALSRHVQIVPAEPAISKDTKPKTGE